MANSIPHALPTRRAKKEPPSRSISTKNSPRLPSAALPSGDLGRYLRAISLPGAPALNFPLWGFRRGADLYPLPITNPSALRPGWFPGELERIPFRGALLKRRDVEQLVEMLAPGPSRADGLPYFRPDLWGWDRDRTKKGRRDGITRRLAAAVASDLGGHGLLEANAKVLGRRPHAPANVGPRGDPNGARELRRHARRYWARLGAWPWTHAPHGKLPKTWRTQDAFLEPLQAWYERARREVDQGLAGSTRAWSEGRSLKRSDLLKLPPEDAIQVEPDELRKKFLQRLERRARAPRP